jgi:hypothetical protein
MHCSKTGFLFDHVVGGGRQRLRHIKTKRFSSLEVDHQLELGGRLNGKLTWFSALEDAMGVRRRHSSENEWAVRDQAADFSE